MAAYVRDTVRRKATDPILVYELQTNLPLGQVLDLSERGLKLMSELPVQVLRVYYCRMPLPEKILGKEEIFFDAECRWCRRNEETTWFDSGYNIRKASVEDAAVIKFLTRKWMIDISNKINKPHQQADKKKTGLLAKIFE